MRPIAAIACAFVFCASGTAAAAQCANPNALGTSRTLVIDNASHMKLGAQQYNETLPLADHEVVLTFDDGPLGPYTSRILDLLAADCVKATYFLVGTMAQANPGLVQRIQKEGHTIGTHSRSHPLNLDRVPLPTMEREIDGGISLVQAALGDTGKLAPFFRIPGLMRSNLMESALASRSLITWSVDLVADDWHRGITADEIAKRALRRLDERGRGILLLHDIHPATALAMPTILKGLKARGFRVVHVVPATASRPKTATEPQNWAANGGKRWRTVVADGGIDSNRPVPSRITLALATKAMTAAEPQQTRHVMAAAGDELRLPRGLWPEEQGRSVVPDDIEPPSNLSVWFGRDYLAMTVSAEEASWPEIRPPRLAEPRKEPNKKAAESKSKNKKLTRPAIACRDTKAAQPGKRCKPASGGHQLSLSGEIAPGTLRAQYSF